LQSRIEDIRALDAEVLAISVDSVEDNRKLATKQRFGFQLLSDLNGKAIEAFGLKHVSAHPMGDQDIARPATFVVDREGNIAWKVLPENWRVRVRPETLIEQLEKIP
jgi:peroxiredoxin